MVLKNNSNKILFLSFLVFLTLAAIDVANAQNSASTKWNSLKLPKVYQTKLDDFLANNNVMKDEGTNAFTKDFVSKEMETDWSISKENQLLFIWHAIYKQVTDKDLYDGQDGDQKIAEDFNNRGVNIRIRACGQKYRNGALAYMNQRSAEARQQSADYDRRTAEARQQSAEARQQSAEAVKNIMKQDSIWIKERMVEFYDIYIQKPSIIKQDDLNFMKSSTKDFIADCKKRGINYRAILQKEVGDAKKVDAILKFYGVE